MVATQSAIEAVIATGMPLAASETRAIGHGKFDGATACVRAGAMLAASASDIVTRAGPGRARKPKAGISATLGETRAHARPSARTSTPVRSKAAISSASNMLVRRPSPRAERARQARR